MSDSESSDRKWKIALVAALVAGPLFGVVASAWAAGTFSDVPESNGFYEEIEWAAANNIIEGYTDGTFRPTNPVSRQAAAAFQSRYNDSIHLVTATRNPVSNTNFFGVATCAAGERAIGGAGFQDLSNLFITDTYLDGPVFTVRWETESNVTADPNELTITAVCAPEVADPTGAIPAEAAPIGADAAIPTPPKAD